MGRTFYVDILATRRSSRLQGKGSYLQTLSFGPALGIITPSWVGLNVVVFFLFIRNTLNSRSNIPIKVSSKWQRPFTKGTTSPPTVTDCMETRLHSYIHICYHRIVITLRNCIQGNSLVFDKLRELLVSLGQNFESAPVHFKCDVLLLMVNFQPEVCL